MRVSASGQGRRAAARLWMCCMGVKQLSRAGNWVVVVAACLQPSPPPLAAQTKDGKAGGGDMAVCRLSGLLCPRTPWMEVLVSEPTADLQGHLRHGCGAVVVPIAGCGLQRDVLGWVVELTGAFMGTHSHSSPCTLWPQVHSSACSQGAHHCSHPLKPVLLSTQNKAAGKWVVMQTANVSG